jgi:hypothetical protein
MKYLWACLVSATVLAAAQAAGQGAFQGEMVVEWLEAPFVPTVRVLQDFGFRQASGKLWPVPRGQVLDGRCMPLLFRDLVGEPFDARFRKSAVVYDSAARAMTEPWNDAQRMFFEASVTEGIAMRDAKVMYLLLAAQGSRWEVSGSKCYGSCHGLTPPLEWRPVVDEAVVGELVKWVRATDPTVEEIDLQARSAIRAYGPHIFPQPACDQFSGSTLVRKSCD